MKQLLITALFLLPFMVASAKDSYPRRSGYDILHYEFNITISDRTDAIEGRAGIDMKLLGSADSVVLDLTGRDDHGKGMEVSNVTSEGKVLRWRHEGSRLVIFPGYQPADDTLRLVVEYNGVPRDGLIISRNKFGDRTFFSDHWPDRAHNYLPCVDHPYDKAAVDFIITAPEQYSVVANGSLVEESSLEGNMKLTHWKEQVPLPVKVMTFGAARFATARAGEAGDVQVWTWVFPQNRSEGFSDYSVAPRPLKYYISQIGEYPFEKLANVQSKTIYGGLENAGAIFYSEKSVNGLGRDEELMAHEIAHQWFGDCVTEADWHHIWLSEGFATYLTSMYMENAYGRQALAADMKHTRERVVKFFLQNPRPVIDTTVTKLMGLLNDNSYQKGAWILHMLRNEIGDINFIAGLRLFYERYRNSNVLSIDFQHVMEEISGRNLDWFFNQWLYKAGQPDLAISKERIKKTGSTEISIEQKQKELFEFNIELLVKDGSGDHIEKVHVKDRKTKVILPAAEISEIIPDPDVKLLFNAR